MIEVDRDLVSKESVIECIEDRDFYSTIYSIISESMWSAFGEKGAVMALKMMLGIIEITKDDYRLIAQSAFNEFVEKSLNESDNKNEQEK